MIDDALRIENDVLFGADDELFLGNGHHHSLDYALGLRALADGAIERFAATLASRRAFSLETGVPFSQLVAPDKHTVLRAAYPVQGFTSHGEALRAAIGEAFLYPAAELAALSARHRPYYRNDTHWTTPAAIVAMEMVALDLGLDASRVAEASATMWSSVRRNKHLMVGDLAQKLTPSPEERTIGLPLPWGVARYRNVVRRNTGRTVLALSKAPTAQGWLLAFGDSFLMGAIGPLTGYFAEILVCRTPHLHRELVRDFDPDYVLCETVERYLDAPVSDDEAQPYLATFANINAGTADAPGPAAAIAKAVTGRLAEVYDDLAWDPPVRPNREAAPLFAPAASKPRRRGWLASFGKPRRRP